MMSFVSIISYLAERRGEKVFLVCLVGCFRSELMMERRRAGPWQMTSTRASHHRQPPSLPPSLPRGRPCQRARQVEYAVRCHFTRFQCFTPSELSAKYLTVFQENVETNNPVLLSYQGCYQKLRETLNQLVSGRAVCQCHQTPQKVDAAESVNVIQYVYTLFLTAAPCSASPR